MASGVLGKLGAVGLVTKAVVATAVAAAAVAGAGAALTSVEGRSSAGEVAPADPQELGDLSEIATVRRGPPDHAGPPEHAGPPDHAGPKARPKG